MSDGADAAGWLWLDGSGGPQRGPLSTASLVVLMQKSEAVRARAATLLVWRPGMDAWVGAAAVPELAPHVLALASAWFLADPAATGGQRGPLTVTELASAFEAGRGNAHGTLRREATAQKACSAGRNIFSLVCARESEVKRMRCGSHCHHTSWRAAALPTCNYFRVSLPTRPFTLVVRLRRSHLYFSIPRSLSMYLFSLACPGELDGLTLLFGQAPPGLEVAEASQAVNPAASSAASQGWRPLAELPALRAAVAALAGGGDDEDDEDEDGNEEQGGGCGRRSGGGGFGAADMTFSAEEQPPLPESFFAAAAGKGLDKGGEKRYVGDDGRRFVMDAATGAWKLYEGDDDWSTGDGDDDENGSDGDGSGGEGGSAARKRGRSNDDGGESAGGGGKNGGDRPKKAKAKKKKKKKDGAWSDKAATSHTWVYVEGLPSDVTEVNRGNSQSRYWTFETSNHCARFFFLPLRILT